MRVERLQQEFDIDVEWRPFELHPEIPAEGYEREKRPSRRPEGYVSPLRQLAQDEGLVWQPSSHVSNSHASLEAAEGEYAFIVRGPYGPDRAMVEGEVTFDVPAP